ncbi:MAG: acyltransferase [Hungatella sp.]|nr:acyltransferase [Hungatella sp.]
MTRRRGWKDNLLTCVHAEFYSCKDYGGAFLAIFISHVDIKPINTLGAWGVSVFLILSGFLMIFNYYGKERIQRYNFIGCIKFAGRKISTLYPLHMVMLICALPFAILSIGTKGAFVFVNSLITNIGLVQSFVPDSAIYFSLNSVAWYLSVSVVLYLCFPQILRFFEEKQFNKYRVLVLIIVVYILQVILALLSTRINVPNISDNFTKWFTYIFPLYRLGDFLIGCSAGYLFILSETNTMNERSGNWNNTILFIILVLIISACIVHSKAVSSGTQTKNLWWSYSNIYAILNAGLVYFLAKQEGLICRIISKEWIVRLGDLSGELFLIHQIVIRYFNVILKRLSISSTIVIFLRIILAFGLSVIIAVLWKAFNENFNRLKKRKVD